MQLMINVNSAAREEIELELELNVPPNFKKVAHAIDWADTHLPINVYFEVWGKNGRVWHCGRARMKVIVNERPLEYDLRCGR